MSNNTAIVTGGSAGIGLSIAEHLLDAGYTVISMARRMPEKTHERLIGVEVDLADRAATKQAASELASQHAITNIVHNAGVIRPALIEDVDLTDLDYLVDLHLNAAISLVQAALPAMKDAQYGRIVMMSSRAIVGLQQRTSYAGTKSAMIAMMRTWALELGEHGITSNAVSPGPVVTDMFTDVMDEESERAQALANSLPMKRLGYADDVARATMFFLDPANGWITGQNLFVCGGSSLGSLVI